MGDYEKESARAATGRIVSSECARARDTNPDIAGCGIIGRVKIGIWLVKPIEIRREIRAEWRVRITGPVQLPSRSDISEDALVVNRRAIAPLRNSSGRRIDFPAHSMCDPVGIASLSESQVRLGSSP